VIRLSFKYPYNSFVILLTFPLTIAHAATGRGGHPLGRHVRIRSVVGPISSIQYTDKKENEIFLIYKKIQMGSVAKSYMRKGFLIFEEMRKYSTIYEEAGIVIYDFATDPF
jgi:hypothetical protein